ncbi:sensor histidine kinase [Bacillus massilinigeriensis]|uniref:sensor histidine kinase n=1 Tax=Bacillus massilionigeriensis TaxID=1805475 RepID=UPI00096B4BC4|nr:sensor histidine kinase [Bacillus massilionigeriensis]
MIKQFILEKLSWIIMFFFLQSFILFVSFLDSSIPFSSVFYIFFLSCIIFSNFLTIRYHKETKFYQSLQEWDNSLDITSITQAESPFEKVIEECLIHQTEQQKQLITQNLIALEQEKDDLLSWIHEIKTPLTTMNLIIERLEDEKIKSQLTHEWLRIHLLLDQQLHQKRIPFIEKDLYIEKLDLKTIIFKEIKTLQSWCIQKGIGFDVQLEETHVLSDGKWLAFMIRQLLTNAVKYSPSSTIIIESFKQDDQIKLLLKDFGRGIDPKDLPRIFEKGFTSTIQHQDTAATGMGLYLTDKIAHTLLIKIDVLSKPGEGTTFTLTFPKRNVFVHITGM